ncbi:MAG: c-type cytochrome [Rhodospirillaceae bacterium]|nr:c-type cytochrome [Rhodospirillaceae bacterium]MBT4219703.1 c-type cytochrome [Rhodospirillaceae bacterium]MBT5013057.1 c-type cytochrome [Rhodospirillaceae bacterium]MBT5309620.1 c-type cytochrome [Rhodospirillaceae bacterium]MBT6407720.1 c-type cytochrome [Rhodospirillaceae bacterium]
MVVVGIAYVNVISDNDSAANDKPQKQTRAEAVALRKKTVALGNRLYADNCAECHGVNLEGQPNWRVKKADGTLPAPPHDATGHTWHHPDSLLFSITKNGGQAGAPAGFVSAMPAFGETLTDSDIWAVLTYIKSRWPAAARKRQKLMTDRAG